MLLSVQLKTEHNHEMHFFGIVVSVHARKERETLLCALSQREAQDTAFSRHFVVQRSAGRDID
jgi:hypothetical protein